MKSSNLHFCFLALLATVFPLGGCGFKELKSPGGPVSSAPPAKVTKQTYVKPRVDFNSPPATCEEVRTRIIEPKCLKCHDQKSQTDLTVSCDDLVEDATLIRAGFPEMSPIFIEVLTGAMPKSTTKQKAAPLSPEEVGMFMTMIRSLPHPEAEFGKSPR